MGVDRSPNVKRLWLHMDPALLERVRGAAGVRALGFSEFVCAVLEQALPEDPLEDVVPVAPPPVCPDHPGAGVAMVAGQAWCAAPSCPRRLA